MKRILLAVFIFVIALASVETAVAFYDCVDKNGQRMITDNPPQGAKCKSMGGEEDAIPTDPQQTGAKLNDLYNRAMNAAEDRERSVGGAAAYHCLPLLCNLSTQEISRHVLMQCIIQSNGKSA